MGYLPGRGRFLGGVGQSVPSPSLTVFGGIESRRVSLGYVAVSGCVTKALTPQSTNDVRESLGG